MTPAEVVNAQLDAYNARDVAAFAATYAEDACIYHMPHSKLLLRGRGQIAEYYGGTVFKVAGLRAHILSRQVIGNKVIDHECAVGIRPEPVDIMAVYEVHGGLIQAVWFYEPHQVSAAPPAGAGGPGNG
jgi:hypothetical protein